MQLVAYIDFKSANARLALKPTLASVGEAGASVDFRPLHLERRLSKLRTAGSARGKLHAEVRSAYRRREQAFYAQAQGIAFLPPDRMFESFAANAGLAWLQRQGADWARRRDYVAQVFEAVWAGRMNPADQQAVAAALAAVGDAPRGFAAYLREQAETDLAEVRDEARSLGANDTPAYLVGGELYVGRAHLPVIRWWLTGQQGEPPIG